MHGRQQGTLHVHPGLNPIAKLQRRKASLQSIPSGVQIGTLPQLDLDRRHTAHATLLIDHATQPLQVSEWYKSEARVIFAHLALVQVDHGKGVADSTRWTTGIRESDLHVVAGSTEVIVVNLAVAISTLETANRNAQDDPGELFRGRVNLAAGRLCQLFWHQVKRNRGEFVIASKWRQAGNFRSSWTGRQQAGFRLATLLLLAQCPLVLGSNPPSLPAGIGKVFPARSVASFT